MGSAKYFISINLRNGYWQCHIANEDFLKATFLMRCGLYKQVVMPMGLTNAPATFIRTMNNLFHDMINSGVAVFLDEILMYLHMVSEHFTFLGKILVCLQQYTFYCRLKKFSFLHNSTTLLSFDITPEGMYISDLKAQSLSEWLVPTTVK